MGDSTRERMVVGATELLSRAGVSAATFANVLARTGAPRGSIYHHFPDGKDQLLAESMRYVGARLLVALRATRVEHPQDVVIAFAGLFRRVLVDSSAAAGCAVAAVTVEAPAASAAESAAREVFRSWRSELATLFARAGVDRDRADALAVVTLAVVEGALILSRAEGDVALYDSAVDELLRVASPGARTVRARTPR